MQIRLGESRYEAEMPPLNNLCGISLVDNKREQIMNLRYTLPRR